MKKALKIYYWTAGVYLFLITGLLLTQPVKGYYPGIVGVLFSCLFYAPLWAFFLAIVIWRKKHSESTIAKIISRKRTLYILLVVLVIIGFILNYDYMSHYGCFVEDEEPFSTIKFILSGNSILLLTVGYFYSNKRFGIAILIIESVIWTLKSVYYGDSLDLMFPGYFTMICWFVRFCLIAMAIRGNRIESVPLQVTKRGEELA